jgi:hypothetical protein
MSCGLAYGVAVFTGVAMIAATIVKPKIWLFPRTWYTASAMIAGNAVNIAECGE